MVVPIDGNDELKIRLQKFTMELNKPVDKSKLRKTPDNKADYIPISMLENDLRTDFNGLVQYAIISERRELNEYIVHARISVFHPILLQWLSYDGIGSVVIMQDKDATLESFNATKKKNALGLNAPKAYAEAIKNAAKKLGIKYGASVNRKAENTEDYQPEELIDEISIEVVEQFEKVTTIAQLTEVFNLYPEYKHLTKFKVLFQNKRIELQSQ